MIEEDTMTTLITLLAAVGTLGSMLLAVANVWLLRPPVAEQKRLYRDEGGK